MTEIEYPSILRRYLATAIDSFIIISMLIAIGYIFEGNTEIATQVRIITVIFLFFVYEPLCTSKLCTVGQKITGIRIRTNIGREKIPLLKAYLRILSKIFLGFISFFTLPFSSHKRAIHDFIAGSIVVEEKR